MLLSLGQRADLLGAELQLDAVADLLKRIGIDGYHLIAQTQEAANLDLDRLKLAVRPARGLENPADILIVGAIDGHPLEVRQILSHTPHGLNEGVAGGGNGGAFLLRAFTDLLCIAALSPESIAAFIDKIISVWE